MNALQTIRYFIDSETADTNSPAAAPPVWTTVATVAIAL